MEAKKRKFRGKELIMKINNNTISISYITQT